MLSRDTKAHLAAPAAGIALLAVGGPLPGRFGADAVLAVGIVAYGVVLAGAHAYLAWRDHDGLVPVDARRRFVAVVALLPAVGAAGALGPEGAVLGVTVDGWLTTVGVATGVAYLALEARSGYLASRTAEER